MPQDIYSKAGADAAFAPAARGAYPVQRVTLTGNLAYTLPIGAPTNQVISVVFTQAAGGPYLVTYAGVDVPLNSTGATVTEWYELGDGTWRVFSEAQPGSGGGEPLAGQPQELTVSSITETTAEASWGAGVPAALGYVIRLNGGPWADLGGTLTYSLAGLNADTSYTVEVAGYMAVGGTAGATATAVFRTLAAALQPTVVDTFDAPSGTSLSTYVPPAGLTWTNGTSLAQCGVVGLGTISLQAVRAATMGATTSGGAYMVGGQRDLRITVGYAFPYQSTFNSQVRIFGRGHVRSNLYPAKIAVDGTYSPSWTEYTNPTTTPKVGTFSLQIVGNTVTTFLNGAPVGTSYDITTSVDETWGFTAYGGAFVTDVKIEPVTGSSPPPTLTLTAPYADGAIITSESWARADAATIGTLTPTNLGAGGSETSFLDARSNFLAISGGKLVRGADTSTGFGGVRFWPGVQDYSITAQLATPPTGGEVRVYGRMIGTGNNEGLAIIVTPTTITPTALGTQYGATAWTGGSFGAPAAGDKYTVTMLGDQVTFLAARSDGTPVGTAQTITHGYWRDQWLCPGIVASLASTGWAVGDIVVRAVAA